jgi:hypothetical protein
MATRFVNIDRDTPLLLPPDLRDWVPVTIGLQPQTPPSPRHGAQKDLNPPTAAVSEDKSSVRSTKTKNLISGGRKIRENTNTG